MSNVSSYIEGSSLIEREREREVEVEVQSGASGERLGWVKLDLGCSTILLGQ